MEKSGGVDLSQTYLGPPRSEAANEEKAQPLSLAAAGPAAGSLSRQGTSVATSTAAAGPGGGLSRQSTSINAKDQGKAGR